MKTVTLVSEVCFDKGCFTVTDIKKNDTFLCHINEICEVKGSTHDQRYIEYADKVSTWIKQARTKPLEEY